MAGDVQPAAPEAGQPSANFALVQACTALWKATGAEQLAATAQALLDVVAPGASAKAAIAAMPDGPPADEIAIALPDDAWLAITPPHAAAKDAAFDAAVAMIRAHVEALSRQIVITEAIEELARAERLQRALYAIANESGNSGSDLAAMLRSLHEIVGTLMYAENFFIALYDAAREGVRFVYYADSVDPNLPYPDDIVPLPDIERGPTWYVIHDRKPLMGSIEQLATQASGPLRGSGTVCVDWLGVPLLRGNELAGCVAVQSYDDAHHFNDEDKALLTYVAQHIQTALERRFAHVELEHRVGERTEALREANRVLQQQVLERQRGERLQASLFRIAELASTTDSIDNFYAAVHRVVGGLLYARNLYIALLSEDGSELQFPYSVDERDLERKPRKLANGLTEYVLRHGVALLANGPEIEKLRDLGEVTRHGTESVCWLGVPLVCAEHTVGALAVQSYSAEHRYTLRDQELLTFVSYHIANALDRVRTTESLKRAYSNLEHRVAERTRALALANRDLRAQIAERERIEARLKYETLHDALTGLPNRALLMQRLERALERYHQDPARGFAVLFLDLDRFKVINDSVGHLIGDDLLFQAGGRVRACLKSEDVVARLGGDEFGVLLEDVSDTRTACLVAERIIEALNSPFRLATKELFTSTSIGITLAAERYRQPEELLRDADSAMYRAKSDGRHRYAVFDEGLRQQAVSVLELEGDLRRGVSRGEFVPYYQPIVRLADGKRLGFEALMRWQHPRRGVLLPSEFLGIAEEIGLSEALDWQLFEHVCRDMVALAGGEDVFVGINLSARHFRSADLDHRLLAMLARYQVPTAHLRVEITERALLENPPEVRRILQSFRNAGVSISLDDFGTGYSSLSYLHQYPIQALKIDQSFIRSIGAENEDSSDAVIRTILAMAKSLSMTAIAEGVETEAQRQALQAMGCELAQGFLFARAQPAEHWTGIATPAPQVVNQAG